MIIWCDFLQSAINRCSLLCLRFVHIAAAAAETGAVTASQLHHLHHHQHYIDGPSGALLWLRITWWSSLFFVFLLTASKMLTNRKPGTPDSENQLNLFPIFNGNMMMGISTRLLRSIMRFDDDCSIEVVRLYWIAIEVLTDETVFATKTAMGELVIPGIWWD